MNTKLFFAFLKSFLPGKKHYQVGGGSGFRYLKLNTHDRKIAPHAMGMADGEKGVPSDSTGLSPTEIKIISLVTATCENNRSRKKFLLSKIFPALHKTREEITNILFGTRTDLEGRKKEFLNVSGRMAKNAPDINTAFERVRDAYEKLCDFRNENHIRSEKEIDLSSYRLVYPLVLSFLIFMEMLFTGFQLAPNLGLGRAYGQFGGLSVLMAFLAYQAGHYYGYYVGFKRKLSAVGRSGMTDSDNVREKFYLPTVGVCLTIMLIIMVFNSIRLPEGDLFLILLWVLFCFFAFFYGLSGEKYHGHRNHIILFRAELNNFKRVLHVYIDQLKTIKQQFDTKVATLREKFAKDLRTFKENIDKVRAIEGAYHEALGALVRSADNLLQSYYNGNSITNSKKPPYGLRIKAINEKINFNSYASDKAMSQSIEEFEKFHADVWKAKERLMGELSKMAKEENKELLTIYNKKLEDIDKLLKKIKTGGSRMGKGQFVSPMNNKDTEFLVISKTIDDAVRNIEKDH